MNRVSDGDRPTSMSFLSCSALQRIIGIPKVLFRYVGNGTRLALTNMDWLNTQKAVILVPDPIAFAPGQALKLSSYKTHRHQFPFARAFLGQALCHLSRQDTSRGVPSQGRHE